MVARRPLVNISGLTTELPPGDSVVGGSVGTLTAGSGLNGGGDLSSAVTVNVSLAPNPSGLLFADGKLGVDGVAGITGAAALASGNFSLSTGTDALASGIACSSLAATALASGNAALADINAIPGGTIETYTAASAVASGYAVGLDDGGSVQSVREVVDADSRVFGSAVVFESAQSDFISTTYDSTNNRVVIAYQDVGNSIYGTAIVGTVSGTSISFGSPVVFRSAATYYPSIAYDSTNSRVVIAYRDDGNSYYGTAVVGTVSGSSISFGTAVVFESALTQYISITYDSTNSKVVISYQDFGNSSFGTSIVGTVSGTSISFGTAVVFESSAIEDIISSTFDSTNSKVVVSYSDSNNSYYGTAIVGNVSGSSISFGTAVVHNSSASYYASSTYDSVNNRVVIVYRNQPTSFGQASIGTVSGTSISFGIPVVFAYTSVFSLAVTYDTPNNKIFVCYRDASNSDYGNGIVGTVSGTSISFGTANLFRAAGVDYISLNCIPTDNRIVIAYRDYGNSYYGTAVVSSPSTSFAPTISSQNNFIGIAQATVASGTDVSVLLPRAVDFNQTGLNPGYFYYVNPTTSGFTAASGQPAAWSGAYNWGPVAKAVSSSGLLLLNPM